MGKYLEIKSADFSQVSLMTVNILKSGPEILIEGNTVSLVASGASAIYYTTDGTTPTTSSNLYTEPFTITISGAITIKAIAVIDGVNTAVSELIAESYSFQNKINEGTYAGSDYSKSRFHYNISALTSGKRYKLVVEVPNPIPQTKETTASSSTFTVRLTSSDSVNTGTDVYVAGKTQFNGLETEFTADSSNPWLYLYFDTTGISKSELPDDSYTFEVKITNID